MRMVVEGLAITPPRLTRELGGKLAGPSPPAIAAGARKLFGFCSRQNKKSSSESKINLLASAGPDGDLPSGR
jgi:hypothetical protein